MAQDYLLDTNAFFNILKAYNDDSISQITDKIGSLTEGTMYISTVTKVEIISVLGKYARGNTGGFQKCNCIISETGEVCSNSRYTQKRKAWNKKTIKGWLKLIKEALDGTSQVINLSLLPFDNTTIVKAEEIVQLALRFSFASMDALIASTALCEIENGHNITVVTADKSLQACLTASNIPWVDISH